MIIGGGSHGLATAYYLRQHGITNVAVLEKSYIGSGAAGRNTTILRSNYKTPEGARFYDASVKLYEGLGAGARLQPAVQPVRPPDARAHRPRDVRDGQPRRGQPAPGDRLAADRPRRGHSSWRRRCTSGPTRRYPIMGALYHPPGGIIRHDAVVWGFARGADAGGAEIHPYTEVTGLERDAATGSPPCRPTAATVDAGHRPQLHRRLVDADRRHGRRAAADHHPHPAGLRDRAGQAVPRRGHRLVADARLHLASPTAASS